MTGGWAAALVIASLVAALALSYVPVGNYMARVYDDTRHLRAERWLYRIGGVDPDADQRWSTYLRSLLAFSLVSVLLLYAILRLQHYLPFANGLSGMTPALAWDTAASFVTNTNWQNYAGGSTLGYSAQLAGLVVQNFVSAAVGIAVAITLVRGFARSRTDRLGNFWVDLVRTCVRILLPVAFLAAIVFIAGGAIENFHATATLHTLVGGKEMLRGGPVASQEAIKQLGTNGGGFFNANSSHPFEDPTAWTLWLQMYLLLVIAVSLPRTFGKMIKDPKQGRAIVAAMAIIALLSLAAAQGFQYIHHGTVPTAVGSARVGTETRFGVPDTTTFATASTVTSTGSAAGAEDSFTSLGGMMPLFNMMLGEVAPGGVGAGLYGMLVLALLSVFIAGLMVGRTPEYLQKKIGGREIKFASLYILATPATALIATAVAIALPGERAAMLNSGPHGLTEVLYAFTSQGNNNGSAFAGLSGNTAFYNIVGGLVMLTARFLPIIFVLGLAGSLARQQPTPPSAGTLPTHRLLFIGLLVGVTLIVVGLTYFPVLALGPLAEGLH